MADVYIFGDFNARTAEYNDFIRFDTLPLDGQSLNMLDYYMYIEDCIPEQRKNVHKCVNTFGKYLLELCKSTGVRIVKVAHSVSFENFYLVMFYGNQII